MGRTLKNRKNRLFKKFLIIFEKENLFRLAYIIETFCQRRATNSTRFANHKLTFFILILHFFFLLFHDTSKLVSDFSDFLDTNKLKCIGQ